MSTINRFEDIESWKKARELVGAIYRLTEVGKFSKDYGLKDQIRRASVSIMSNIAEGFERDGKREFSQFLSIAKGSAGEVRSQLYIALDIGHISQNEFDKLFDLTESTARLISGLMKYLINSDIRGRKFLIAVP